MRVLSILILILTINPVPATCQPQKAVIITAYCLTGHTTSGPRTAEVHQNGGCLALSRKLAKDLGLKKGPGRYDYKFGTIIEVNGIGRFIFADLMPSRWTGYRVDIYYPTKKECIIFGVKKCQIKIINP